MRRMITKVLLTSVLMSLVVLPVAYVPKVSAWNFPCDPCEDLLCDNFLGRTFYTDENPDAIWHRYPDLDNYAADYISTGRTLKLQINSSATATDYSNANISTNIINQVNPYLRFGVNTRAEVLMRYSPNFSSNPMDPGTAMGSAGFLFWNYFKTEVAQPETGVITKPQEVFGWVWGDRTSTLPGLKILGIADGIPGAFVPMIGLDITQWHEYAIERRHESIKWFVDSQLVAELPLNQVGTLQLPDDHGLAMDVWVDNASYHYDLAELIANLTFNELDTDQWVEIEYAQATAL